MAAVPSRGYAAAANPSAASAAVTTHELYERFGRQIFRFCQRQLRNREEAEDATQTTFLNAFRALERGPAVEFESAWLYKIALNVCMSRQRSSKRRGRLELVGDLESMQERLPAREEKQDELFGLDVALRRMPEQQRRALLLREWQGLTYRDMEDQGFLLVLTKVEVRYRSPARYDDVLTIRTTVTRSTPIRVEHRYEVFRDGTLLAEGATTLVCVDRDGKLQAMPTWLSEAK